MDINEVIANYLEALEDKSNAEKREKLYKGLLIDYIKTNNISDPNNGTKEKIPFETENYNLILDKNVQERFDQKTFFSDFPTAKKEYLMLVPIVKIIATEKQKEQKTA